jgi:hypothetical protein
MIAKKFLFSIKEGSKMSQNLDVKSIEDIISFYETGIQGIEDIFTDNLILEEFQESNIDTKQEKEKINERLRDILAKNESLRKKDFDNMMQGILLSQEQREKEVKNLLRDYFNDQKNIAQALREDLKKFKDFLVRGEVERIKEFHSLIKEIIAMQAERSNEITAKLKAFQKEHHEMIKKFKELLAKGKDLRIGDFKLMLKEFNGCYKERITQQEERREEVQRMLGEFRKERKTFIRHESRRRPCGSRELYKGSGFPFSREALDSVSLYES